MKTSKSKVITFLTAFGLLPAAFFTQAAAQQTTPPAPGAPKAVVVPQVTEKKLPNNLRTAVIERKNVPVVTVQLLIKSGASSEPAEKSGLANMTASLLTKGTTTRSATQIAEEIEFLGGEINTGAGWNNSVVTVSVMSDKLDKALAVMSDVVLNPAFKQEEIDLLKNQTLDGLNFNLKQPGFLASYVASVYSYNEHPAGGTPDSIKAITAADIRAFHQAIFNPSNAVLIFTGDITGEKAAAAAAKYFGKWQDKGAVVNRQTPARAAQTGTAPINRILVVDLPNAGQASVNYLKSENSGRVNADDGKYLVNSNYFPAQVLNSVLGGGYSSRLNQEIRIKRGLSYGANSGFAWRSDAGNFGARTQTKNESAAEVAQLIGAEITRLADSPTAESELVPRKSVLTGNFGRNLETTEGLAAAIADLYSFNLPVSELNGYTANVVGVTDAQIRNFAGKYLLGGDIVIVGDYAKFKDDLVKRFPAMKINVIKAAELNLNGINLQK